MTLVPAIERGVNEHEIGKIVDFGHRASGGARHQLPARVSCRPPCARTIRMQRMTIPDILRLIEEQTDGMFRDERLRAGAVLLSDLQLRDLRVSSTATGRTPLPRLVDVDDYLDYITNRVMPDFGPEIKHALEGLWSSSSVAGSEKVARASSRSRVTPAACLTAA